MTSPSPAISVIVPVYNTGPYLEECLNSVVDQAFQDLEILIVNDGSTDGSPDIIRKYSERDKRIVVFNKQNEGVALARNTALAAACGTYVMFLDSDDAFAPGAIATLYERICRADCDILVFNGRAVRDGEAIRGSAGEFYFDLGRQDEDMESFA